MKICEVSVRAKIVALLNSCFGIPETLLAQKNWNKPLTGVEFSLKAFQLAYLLFEIEKNQGIRIQEQSFDNYGFATINGIADAVLYAFKFNNR